MVENEANIDPASIALETVTVKDAVALLFSFAQAINPKLKSGMVLMADLHLEGERLLLTKGTALNGSTVRTLQSFGDRKLIPNKINVRMPQS